MTSMVYLVGGAGVGKSTVMDLLLGEWVVAPNESLANGFNGHWMDHPVIGSGLYLGDRSSHREFQGTDCLARHSPPYVRAWFEEALPSDTAYVYAEGQRLATRTLLPRLHQLLDLTIVHLVLDDATAAARREERSQRHAAASGGEPLVWADTWVRGNFTRAANIANDMAEAGLRVVQVEAGLPPELVAAEVAQEAGLPFNLRYCATAQ